MTLDYEAVIGLEIHVQLNCPTKMFCRCPNRAGDEPNLNTCPICLWLPGNLPRFSRGALEKAILAGLALNCEIQRQSAFDQKVYYYPDLPKGYQLSQFHHPLARNGWLDITDQDGVTRTIRIQKIHMEEDVARLVHEKEGRTSVSLVDFNRAGAPLVEIVTQPDLRGPHQAMEFLRCLRVRLRTSGCSDCSMEQGTMRVDANVSLRARGTDQMSTKVEIKNMNSIRHVGDAIAYEINRQADCHHSGEPVVLHTRLWDPDNRVTTAMRGKFEGPCIPDPSVPRIVIDDGWLEALRRALPEMPDKKADRFSRDYGLSREEAAMMSAEREWSDYLEAVVERGVAPKLAAQWIIAQLVPLFKAKNQAFSENAVKPERFAELLLMVQREQINAKAARDILKAIHEKEASPEEIVAGLGLHQVSETGEIESLVDRVLAENASAVENYRKGASKAMGFLMGQAMQASGGKANPRLLKEVMERKLQ